MGIKNHIQLRATVLLFLLYTLGFKRWYRQELNWTFNCSFYFFKPLGLGTKWFSSFLCFNIFAWVGKLVLHGSPLTTCLQTNPKGVAAFPWAPWTIFMCLVASAAVLNEYIQPDSWIWQMQSKIRNSIFAICFYLASFDPLKLSIRFDLWMFIKHHLKQSLVMTRIILIFFDVEKQSPASRSGEFLPKLIGTSWRLLLACFTWVFSQLMALPEKNVVGPNIWMLPKMLQSTVYLRIFLGKFPPGHWLGWHYFLHCVCLLLWEGLVVKDLTK